MRDLAQPLPRRYWLCRAHVPSVLRPGLPDGLVAVGVEEGRILGVAAHPPEGEACIDLDGATLTSGWVDPHTHLDKGDLLATGLEPAADLMSAVNLVRADQASWTPESVRRRADFALRTAIAHGTRALNSYCDWAGVQPGPAWEPLQRVREQWRPHAEMTLTALVDLADLRTAEVARDVAVRVRDAQAVLGVFVYPGAPLEHLVHVFDVATSHGLRLDFHVDEHLRPDVSGLRRIAALAREREWGSRTVCGHACALMAVDRDTRQLALDEVAEAGISLVALPYTNLYLQDSLGPGTPRQDATVGARRTPLRRGLLPIHEARQRGITVAVASDNHRDPFFPGGDLDPLQTLALAALVGQMDRPLEDWCDTVTTSAAAALGLSWDGVLRTAAPADLVIHPARNSIECLARPAAPRRVIRHGQWLDAHLAVVPDFRELDDLRTHMAQPS